MRCGCNTNTGITAIDDQKVISVCEAIKRFSEAGFESIDLGATKLNTPGFFLLQEDWERQIDEIGETAAKHDIAISQLHLPYHKSGGPEVDSRFQTPGFAELFATVTRRAYIAGGRLGIPWAVAHVMSPAESNGDAKYAAAVNHDYYDELVEFGIKNGIGTAFENMLHRTKPGKPTCLRYGSHYRDLIDFVDSYGDPMVQICWDFGHANVAGFDQCRALREVGKRLKCVHMNDNFATGDHHVPPFIGNINWEEVIPVLAEIGYEGEFSLEIGNYLARTPRATQDALLKGAFACANRARDMFYEAQKAL